MDETIFHLQFAHTTSHGPTHPIFLRSRLNQKLEIICTKLYPKNLESHPTSCGPSSISLVIFVEKIEVNKWRSLQFHSFIRSFQRFIPRIGSIEKAIRVFSV